jgi:hypothetical protein
MVSRAIFAKGAEKADPWKEQRNEPFNHAAGAEAASFYRLFGKPEVAPVRGSLSSKFFGSL